MVTKKATRPVVTFINNNFPNTSVSTFLSCLDTMTWQELYDEFDLKTKKEKDLAHKALDLLNDDPKALPVKGKYFVVHHVVKGRKAAFEVYAAGRGVATVTGYRFSYVAQDTPHYKSLGKVFAVMKNGEEIVVGEYSNEFFLGYRHLTKDKAGECFYSRPMTDY